MNARKILAESIIDLLEKDTIDNITVNMIIKKSGVARATFYKYFHDKMDLMMYIFHSFMQTNFEYSSNVSHVEIYTRSLELMKNNQKYFTNAFKSEGQNSCAAVLCDYSIKLCEASYVAGKGIDKLTFEEKMWIDFNTAGAIVIIKKWVQSGMNEPPEMIAKLIYSCMPEALRKYIRE